MTVTIEIYIKKSREVNIALEETDRITYHGLKMRVGTIISQGVVTNSLILVAMLLRF